MYKCQIRLHRKSKSNPYAHTMEYQMSMEQNSFGERKRQTYRHTSRQIKKTKTFLSHITQSYRLDLALDISCPMSVNRSFLHSSC